MDWITNANTITGLMVSIVVIGGYISAVILYLRKKASPTLQQTETLSQMNTVSQKAPLSYPSFTWLEWTALLAQSVVDTADFILHICFRNSEVDADDMSIIGKLGLCLGACIVGGIFAVFPIGIILIGLLLSSFGMKNPTEAAGVSGLILYLLSLSFSYIYHVGLRLEQKRQEQYQALKGKKYIQQSTH